MLGRTPSLILLPKNLPPILQVGFHSGPLPASRTCPSLLSTLSDPPAIPCRVESHTSPCHGRGCVTASAIPLCGELVMQCLHCSTSPGQYLCTGMTKLSPEAQWHERRWETLAEAQVGKLAGARDSVHLFQTKKRRATIGAPHRRRWIRPSLQRP